MDQPKGPPRRAEHVGTLIRPHSLIAALQQACARKLDDEALSEIHEKAIHEAVCLQQDIGLRAITDGAFRHTNWQEDILLKLDGVIVRKAARDNLDPHPGVNIVGCLRREQPLYADAFRVLAGVVRETPRALMPFADIDKLYEDKRTIDRNAYPDRDQFIADLVRIYREEIADLAKSGCRSLVIYNVSSGAMPTKTQGTMEWQFLRDTVNGHPDGLSIYLHVLPQAGNGVPYERVAAPLLNEIDADGYILDFHDSGERAFDILRELPKEKIVALGLVSVGDPRLELKDTLKRRIETASKRADIGQLALSATAGFRAFTGNQDLSLDDQKRKLDLIVTTAINVWGSN